MSTTFRKYSCITVDGVRFVSKADSIVYVTDRTSLMPRPVAVNYFMLHSLHYKGTTSEHVFAVVTWLKEHNARSFYSKPLELWWKELVDNHLDLFNC